MRTASIVQFPKSVFKAQGIFQVAYEHPRDVKTGGSDNALMLIPLSLNSIVCNVDFKSIKTPKLNELIYFS